MEYDYLEIINANKSSMIALRNTHSNYKNVIVNYGNGVENNLDCSGNIFFYNYRSGSAKIKWVSVNGVN